MRSAAPGTVYPGVLADSAPWVINTQGGANQLQQTYQMVTIDERDGSEDYKHTPPSNVCERWTRGDPRSDGLGSWYDMFNDF